MKLGWFDSLKVLVLVAKLSNFRPAVWSPIFSQSTKEIGDDILVGSLVDLVNRSYPLLHNSI